MPARNQKQWQHGPGARKQRPHEMWRAVRNRAKGMRAPASVLVVLDHLVETQALAPHLPLARIRLGYGRHSEKERAWDRRRRAQVAEEVGARRLVQLPKDERDGFAERTGISRRTVIRAAVWLRGRSLVHIFHELGVHSVPDRYGTEHEMGRGGCLPGGKGCAATWLPGVPPPPPAPPEPEPEPPSRPREKIADVAARLGRAPGDRGP